MTPAAATHCHHCGIQLAWPVPRKGGARVWCLRCSAQPQGKCTYCRHDVLDGTACWTVQQALDRALVVAGFTPTACRDCGHEMEVTMVRQDGRVGEARFTCRQCGAYLNLAWHRPRKPPEPPIGGAAPW